MSGSTDPFLVLVDDIGALRRQIENLQRTSLDRDEAEHLNATIAQSLDNMAQTGKRLEQRLEGQLQLATAKTHRDAIEGVCCRTVLNPTLSSFRPPVLPCE